MRGISTTVDALLFVLLVGAAVAVLTGAQPGQGPPTRVADDTADVLATSTAGLTYEQSATVVAPRLFGSDESRTITFERTENGTYASLLATAAVAGAELDGEALTGTGDALERAVVNATARVLPTREAAVEVRVVWRPYPGAPLSNEVVAGERPPADAKVDAATLVVPSGAEQANATRAARERGYAGVASVAARAVIDGLFPPRETAAALRSDGPDRALAAHRYRAASERLGVDGEVGPDAVPATNRRLAAALAARLESDLRERYDSAAAAARDLRADRARIVVRTWSP